MYYNKDLIARKLRRWERYLSEYRLPSWEEIPDFGLYMDQVVTLLKTYLDYMPPELKEEQIITPAAINNYVRKKIMPEPIKKKYYRTHIAYLIMVCSMKQSLSIPTLKTMIPTGLNEEELIRTYSAYVIRHRIACEYFGEQVKIIAGGILSHQPEKPTEVTTDDTGDLIIMSAVISGLSRLMAEKLLLLEGQDMPEDQIAEEGQVEAGDEGN